MQKVFPVGNSQVQLGDDQLDPLADRDVDGVLTVLESRWRWSVVIVGEVRRTNDTSR